MVRRWVLPSVVGLSCLGLTACNQMTAGTPPAARTAADKPAPVDPGAPLYKGETVPKMDSVPVIEDQIVVPNAVVRLSETQTVPAQLDGYVSVIATPLPAGMPYDKNDKMIVLARDMNEMRPFRRLQEGDRVSRDQIVCLFDDIEIMVQIENSQKIIKECEGTIVEAQNGARYIQEQIEGIRRAGDAVAKSELLNLQATLSRYKENVFSSTRERVKSEGDEKRAWTLREKHRARSKVNGIITKIIRRAGEFAKAGEPIMEILSTEEQMVEGNLDAKDAGAVLPGMKVLVEPTMPTGPDTKYGNASHRLEVTGV
ncbi:MAG: HlyD family efflux transporter periplasmic adaptor subunit, partial [Gemmataceae bacterium]